MAFKALGTAQGAGGGTQLTTPWPAGHADKDVAVLVVVSRQAFGDPGAATLATANGFVAVTGGSDLTNDGTWQVRTTKFWCRANGGSMASPVVATDTGSFHAAVIITFDGRISTGNPIDGTPGLGANASSNTDVVAPGPTTTVANCDVLIAIGYMTTPTTGSYSNANLTGITERMDANPNGGTAHITLATATAAAAGAIGDTTATLSGAETWTSVVIALKPEPPTLDPGGGGGRPRSHALMQQNASDPRIAMRMRQVSDRPRDLRLLSRAHAPDGYSQGLVRSGHGSGYLTDLEAGTIFTPYVERVADMTVLRPRRSQLVQPRRQVSYGRSSGVAVLPASLTEFVQWTPNHVPVGMSYATVVTAGVTVSGQDQTSVLFTVRIDNGLLGAPTDAALSGCINGTGWAGAGSYWEATYIASADPVAAGATISVDINVSLSEGTAVAGTDLNAYCNATSTQATGPGATALLTVDPL